MRVLVLNCGSSSIKYELFHMGSLAALARGALEGIGERGGLLRRRGAGPPGTEESVEPALVADHREGLGRVLGSLTASGSIRGPADLRGIGHRVVHGGERFVEPVLVDRAVVEAIRSVSQLAPLHNPANLLGMEMALAVCPGVPQVAVFDTAFHQSLPPHAYRYALPGWAYQRHRVRRYGFHGTSHAYVARRAAEILGRPLEALKLVTLHLGNGASAAAIEGGRSLDTSMGLTPLEGLVMGTRSGDIDPAVIFHLARTTGTSLDELERMLNEQSGLFGLCGTRHMREVVERAEAGDADAGLALDLYCYRVKKYVGAYLAVLGRVDALVFTAGVGENSPAVRERCCRGLEPLGVVLDDRSNRAESTGARAIHAPASAVKVLVVPTDEELEIARQTLACIEAAERGRRP